jgi:hypothetical protein
VLEPVHPRQVPARAHPLDGDHHDASDDERGGDGQRAEEVRLDGLAQEETRDGGRRERDDERDEKAARRRVPREEPTHPLREKDAIVRDDGEDGPQLDHDLEGRGRRIVIAETQPVPDEDQVARRRHRKKLGEPLDDAEQNRDDDGHSM